MRHAQKLVTRQALATPKGVSLPSHLINNNTLQFLSRHATGFRCICLLRVYPHCSCNINERQLLDLLHALESTGVVVFSPASGPVRNVFSNVLRRPSYVSSI